MISNNDLHRFLVDQHPEEFKWFVAKRLGCPERAMMDDFFRTRDPKEGIKFLVHLWRESYLILESFIEAILKDPKLFDRLINNSYWLLVFAKAFPEFPERGDLFIQKSGILKNADRFKQIVKTGSHFAELAQAFPMHAKTLIEPILSDPEEFKRLFPNDDVLHAVSSQLKAFPEYRLIFSQRTVADALLIAAKQQSQKNALSIEKEAPKTLSDLMREHQLLINNALPEKHRKGPIRARCGIFTVFHGERGKFFGKAVASAQNSEEYEAIIQHQLHLFSPKKYKKAELPQHLDEHIKKRLNQKIKTSAFKGYHGYFYLLKRLLKDIQDFRASETKTSTLQLSTI